MSGRVFLLGDDIDTDQLAPGGYMSGGLDTLARHCLEAVRPDFAPTVRPGDVVVAGGNFGMGSSREQAAQALKHLGVVAVIARSFAGIFYRNAINIGLPVIRAAEVAGVRDGERVELDADMTRLAFLDRDGFLPLEPIPENILRILGDGGIVPHLKKRFAVARPAENGQ